MTRDTMWIDTCYKPDWIKCTFEKAESTIKGYVQRPRLVEFRPGSELNVSEAQRVRGNSGWEIPSLEEALTSLERMPHPPSVEELAGCYVAEIKRRQPEGPYLIGGYSFGGVAAYEAARQLMESGDEVEKLILIDTACPTFAKSMPDSLVQFLDAIHAVHSHRRSINC